MSSPPSPLHPTQTRGEGEWGCSALGGGSGGVRGGTEPGPVPPCVVGEPGRGSVRGRMAPAHPRGLVLKYPYCTIAEAKSNCQAALKWE